MIEAPASTGKVILRITGARRGFGPGVLQPRFQKTSGYPESARSTRGTAQPVFVFFRQIQQAPFRELIGIFSEAAAPVSLLLQK
jgi:hypothetical protein